MKTKFANHLLIAIAGLSIIGIFFIAAIPQDPHYHHFADQRTLCGVNHCFGSGYYHLSPDNHTLVWDRLPMTIAFMALFSLLLHERVLPTQKTITLIPLLIIGAASVFYWDWTESQGKGDLRLYALVQFLPILLIPLILWLYPKRYLNGTNLLWAFVFYFAAKLLEHFDGLIYERLDVISGHSVKHISAAVAVLFIIYAVPATAKISLHKNANG